MMSMMDQRINIDKPLWDLNSYWGRWKYYSYLFDFKNVFYMRRDSYNAYHFCQAYKLGNEPPGTTLKQVLYHKKVKDSTFHALTGERHLYIHRLACMVPIQASLCVFGACVPQAIPLLLTANALQALYTASLGYTYRNTDPHNRCTIISRTHNTVYLIGTWTAVSYYHANLMLQSKHRFIRALLPTALFFETTALFLAYIRINEYDSGVFLRDENGKPIVKSRTAGIKGISESILARFIIIGSTMLTIPVVVHLMDKSKSFSREGNLSGLRLPTLVLLSIAVVGASTPVAFALFPSESSISTSTLRTWEPSKYKEVKKYFNGNVPEKLGFSSGL